MTSQFTAIPPSGTHPVSLPATRLSRSKPGDQSAAMAAFPAARPSARADAMAVVVIGGIVAWLLLPGLMQQWQSQGRRMWAALQPELSRVLNALGVPRNSELRTDLRLITADRWEVPWALRLALWAKQHPAEWTSIARWFATPFLANAVRGLHLQSGPPEVSRISEAATALFLALGDPSTFLDAVVTGDPVTAIQRGVRRQVRWSELQPLAAPLRERHIRVVELDAGERGGDRLPYDSSNVSATERQALTRLEVAEAVRRADAGLSPRDRRLLGMVAVGYSVAEAGHELRMSEEAAWQAVSRAQRKLRPLRWAD